MIWYISAFIGGNKLPVIIRRLLKWLPYSLWSLCLKILSAQASKVNIVVIENVGFDPSGFCTSVSSLPPVRNNTYIFRKQQIFLTLSCFSAKTEILKNCEVLSFTISTCRIISIWNLTEVCTLTDIGVDYELVWSLFQKGLIWIHSGPSCAHFQLFV